MIRNFALAASFTLTSLMSVAAAKADTAIVAGGCFWCVESDFDSVKGVTATTSGYIGGKTQNPTYKTYSKNGHREAVKIEYDPSQISYREILDIFFRTVDPTDPGGQFCDRGRGYTTAIYALDGDQAKTAAAAKADAQAALGQTIVTPVENAGTFWDAEDFHQNYAASQERQLTRFGYITRAKAYKGYRKACGRDDRVRQLWGDQAYQGVSHGS